jgi:hypothetical protein
VPVTAGKVLFTKFPLGLTAMRIKAVHQVEADLVALKLAADRAGTALACLFSSADEFEAAVVRARRLSASRQRRWPMRLSILMLLIGVAVIWL